MVAFLAIRWPWDLSVTVVVGLFAFISSRWMQTAFPHAVLLYAFLFLTPLVVVGAYLAASVYQTWLPAPAIAGLGVVAALCGGAWVRLVSRQGIGRSE